MTRVTTADETPVFIDTGQETVFAIVTRPIDTTSDVAIVNMSGGPKASASVGRNRFYVRMCRALAAAGTWAVRFDYHGTGESSGELEQEVSLDAPFVGDVRAIYEWLESQGIHKYVFVGTCFGSRAALASAPIAPGLVGMALMAPPLRDMRMGEANANLIDSQLTHGQWLKRAFRPAIVRGLRDPQRRKSYARIVKVKIRSVLKRSKGKRSGSGIPRWMSPTFLAGIQAVVDRQLPLLLIYGENEPFYLEFEQARQGVLGDLLDRAGDRLTLVTVPHHVHGFTSIEVQQQSIDTIVSWVTTHFGHPFAQ